MKMAAKGFFHLLILLAGATAAMASPTTKPPPDFSAIASDYERGDHAAAFAGATSALRHTGDAKARTLIARLYLLGQGTVRHVPTALMHYEKAAMAGYAPAQWMYAAMLDRGLGVAANPANAMKWLQAAAEQGHLGAILSLAEKLQAGSGITADVQAAEKWLLIATRLAGPTATEVATRVGAVRKMRTEELSARDLALAEESAVKWLREKRTVDPEWLRPVNAMADLGEVANFHKAARKPGEGDKNETSAFTRDYFPKQ